MSVVPKGLMMDPYIITGGNEWGSEIYVNRHITYSYMEGWERCIFLLCFGDHSSVLKGMKLSNKEK